MRFVNSESSPFNTYLHLPRKEKEGRVFFDILSYKTSTKTATFSFIDFKTPFIALFQSSFRSLWYKNTLIVHLTFLCSSSW